MPLDAKLLEILACPDCHGSIKYHPQFKSTKEHLSCTKCQRQFAIKSGIPTMMPKN